MYTSMDLVKKLFLYFSPLFQLWKTIIRHVTSADIQRFLGKRKRNNTENVFEFIIIHSTIFFYR